MPAAHLGFPEPQGLYHPANEHDACGVAMVADVAGRRGHGIVVKALTALCNLDHRGAKGSEPDTGDGAGILTQIPDTFFRTNVGFALPAAGHYAVGMAFLPFDGEARDIAFRMIEEIAAEEGLNVLGWREVPVDRALPGPSARAVMPHFTQLFVASPTGESGLELDRLAFCLRKRAEKELDVYFPSLSARTLVYKGMLTTGQLEPFFPDLSDRRFATELA
ncbi:MAG TPA: glutamate synthase subunit alpha, partial [Nonomuraea sp.]|nr:glutamate synthase subunit alpha [Nonomuraea sp.]